MRHFDLTPLHRATVGFDRLADLMDRAAASEQGQTYPPYNIERTGENAWRITVAVAGFGEDELSVEMRENALIISGRKAGEEGADSKGRTFLHRGIANRAFERRFHLAEHVRATGARVTNGMLDVELVREVPEALKPRRIEITSGQTVETEVVEAEAA